jgi:hypothetical protein
MSNLFFKLQIGQGKHSQMVPIARIMKLAQATHTARKSVGSSDETTHLHSTVNDTITICVSFFTLSISMTSSSTVQSLVNNLGIRIRLSAMRAVDEIDEEDSRQVYHNLDSVYAKFT